MEVTVNMVGERRNMEEFNRTVWKYNISQSLLLDIPKHAKALAVQIQNDEICIWFEVDMSEETERREFVIHATGDIIDERERYIATVQDCPWVWHVYEKVRMI